MIYTRFGTPIKIIGDCGFCTPKGFKAQVNLLQVIDITQDEPTTEYQFAEFLKSDNGYSEINASIQLAPRIHLNGPKLSSAIFQAL